MKGLSTRDHLRTWFTESFEKNDIQKVSKRKGPRGPRTKDHVLVFITHDDVLNFEKQRDAMTAFYRLPARPKI